MLTVEDTRSLSARRDLQTVFLPDGPLGFWCLARFLIRTLAVYFRPPDFAVIPVNIVGGEPRELENCTKTVGRTTIIFADNPDVPGSFAVPHNAVLVWL